MSSKTIQKHNNLIAYKIDRNIKIYNVKYLEEYLVPVDLDDFRYFCINDTFAFVAISNKLFAYNFIQKIFLDIKTNTESEAVTFCTFKNEIIDLSCTNNSLFILEDGKINRFKFTDENKFLQCKHIETGGLIKEIAATKHDLIGSDCIKEVKKFISKVGFDVTGGRILDSSKYSVYIAENQKLWLLYTDKQSSHMDVIYKHKEYINSLSISDKGGLGIINGDLVDFNSGKRVDSYEKQSVISKGKIYSLENNKLVSTVAAVEDRELSLRPNTVENKKASLSAGKVEKFYNKNYAINLDDSNEIIERRRRPIFEDDTDDFIENNETILRKRDTAQFETKKVIKRHKIQNKVNLQTNRQTNNFIIKQTGALRLNANTLILQINKIGYMESIRDDFVSKIRIIYHNQEMESVDFIDTKNCHLGAFIEYQYIISNGKILKTREIEIETSDEVEMVGINYKYIYTIDTEEILKIYDHSLKVINEYYVGGTYAHCADDDTIALFNENGTSLILRNLTGKIEVKRINSGIINFATFDLAGLYVKIKNNLFILENMLLAKIKRIEENVVAINDGYAVIMPDIAKLEFQYIKLDREITIEKEQEEKLPLKTEEKENLQLKTSRFNPNDF